MKLLEQILSELGADTLKSITLIPGSCCFLKSVKGVLDFSSEHIRLAVGKKAVTLEGEELQVGEFFEGDILIKGNIKVIKID